MVPVGPVRHQVGVGDQHARGVDVGADHGHRLARLHQQRLVVFELLQLSTMAVEVFPGARGPADAAIDHQLVRVFGHVRMQIVHQHAHRRFGEPALRGDLGAGRRIDVALVVSGLVMIGLPMMLQGQQLNSECLELNAQPLRLLRVIDRRAAPRGQMRVLCASSIWMACMFRRADRNGGWSSRP
jgi:hypothetical protein